MPIISNGLKKRRQEVMRYNQIINKVLDYLYQEGEYDDLEDYLSNNQFNKLRDLRTNQRGMMTNSPNWKRIHKIVKRIRREAMNNWIEGDITDYTYMLSKEEIKEHKYLMEKIYA